MKATLLQIYAVTILTLGMVHFGVGLPILPKDVSQVQAFRKMLDDPRPDFYVEPAALATNLYRFAFSETNHEQPYGIHLALQSQTFYRQMIDVYFVSRVKPILDRLAASASTGASRARSTKLTPGQLKYNVRDAHMAYDKHLNEFWKEYQQGFTDSRAKRVQSGDEADDINNILPVYDGLPKEKKQVFTKMMSNGVSEGFNLHAQHIFSNIFGLYVDLEKLKVGVYSPTAQRRIGSAGATTSYRQTEP